MPRSPDPWQVIEALAGTPATLYEWRQRLGRFFPAANTFLAPAPEVEDFFVPCAACSRPVAAFRETREVYRTAHDLDAPCNNTDTLAAADAAMRILDPAALGRRVAFDLRLFAPSAEDLGAAPSLIGYTARPTRQPVFLVFNTDTDAYRASILRLLANHAPPFVVLTATPRESLRRQFASQGLHTLDLPMFFQWTPEGLVHNGGLLAVHILSTAPGASGPTERFALARGIRGWSVTFEGVTFPVYDQKGMDYVAHLLRDQPSESIHSFALAAAVEYAQRTDAAPPVDPHTGRGEALSRDATIQQLNLSRDDMARLAKLRRRFAELTKTLQDDAVTGMERAEVEEELEAVVAEVKTITGSTRDDAGRKADAIRKTMDRLCLSLRALPVKEKTARAARDFAAFIENQILNPSARYGRTLRARSAQHAAGCFIYEPPPGVHWT